MRYRGLACDFDGTLAHHGIVDDCVVDALCRCRSSGRKLIMVTGRELSDLAATFSQLEVFDRIVAENGATAAPPPAPDRSSEYQPGSTYRGASPAPNVPPRPAAP